jgi:hypothetical protein
MQYLYHVLSLREPVFIRPAELGGIQHVFFINFHFLKNNDDENSLYGEFEYMKRVVEYQEKKDPEI